MGRTIPMAENPSINPILSLYLFAASAAAVMALVSSLCISRKKSPSPTASHRKTEENLDGTAFESPHAPPLDGDVATAEPPRPPFGMTAETEKAANDLDEEVGEKRPLPPPPGMSQLRGTTSYNFRSTSVSTSMSMQAKLKKSLSLRVQGGGLGLASGMRQLSRLENRKQLKHEDSIWKKAIILGDKCRPEDDDTIVYDEKGRPVSTYHPKAPCSVAISRQESSIDQDAIPSTAAGEK
ncbi:hypothetical protein NMG60_11027762 [Bertholletia excelsa]